MVIWSSTRMPKITQWEMDSLFNKWCLKNSRSHAKEWSWTFTVYHIKFNSKWIKDLNLRPKTIKLLEENKGDKLEDAGIGKNLLDDTKIDNKNKNRQLELHQTYFLCIKRQNQQSEKATYIMGENMCKSYTWWGVNIYIKNTYKKKEYLQLNNKKSNSPIKKSDKGF